MFLTSGAISRDSLCSPAAASRSTPLSRVAVDGGLVGIRSHRQCAAGLAVAVLREGGVQRDPVPCKRARLGWLAPLLGAGGAHLRGLRARHASVGAGRGLVGLEPLALSSACSVRAGPGQPAQLGAPYCSST